MSVNKYEFLEWYKLDPCIRADLVTMIEGVRQGAKIELWKLEKRNPAYFAQQKPLLEFCAAQLALVCGEHEGVYYFSRDAAILRQFWCGELKEGEFLGYPACCVEAFEAGCEKAMAEGMEWGPAVQFWRKAGERHNRLFDFLLHVPCGIHCEPSLKLTAAVEQVLEKYDIGAAIALMKSNRQALYEFHRHHPEK